MTRLGWIGNTFEEFPWGWEDGWVVSKWVEWFAEACYVIGSLAVLVIL
ncbi:MAG: hypothetical protein PHC31_13230 [Clostridia bacterium]|nr:hypothetical protein [Clostridia bacterium]